MALERADLLHAIGVFRDLAASPPSIVNWHGFDGFARLGVGDYALTCSESIAYPESTAEAHAGANELVIVGAQVTTPGTVRVRCFDTLGNPIDPVQVTVTVLQVQAGPAGNSALPPMPIPIPVGGGIFSLLRADVSVNGAYVEAPYSARPILHTQANVNPAGSFNGGGLGNKGLLGFRSGIGLALGLLSTFEYTYRDLFPSNATPPTECYANFVILLGGVQVPPAAGAYRIGVIDPASPLSLSNGAVVTNGDGSKTVTFDASNATKNCLLIVNGLQVPPGNATGLLPPFVAPTHGTGVGLPGTWPSNSYDLAAITGAYPAASLVEASSADGGLPKAPNKTPPILLVSGGSTNTTIRAVQVYDVKLNGVPI